ncbi:hypothetical protein PDESU_04028 [Pontiella desulfatans]|uniref:PEP-CTERM protein-sorting domain-containing protein n=1 Tax=Pontiella desulfatans TaxID=2750659 RepID=A0A6C2U695_PONDE|nr:PEP-CTERM sorting domain-containing protein [Pontiella desulfatans]VGO15445.1 hypothetical protein PDESU_04028 [Pontiella desulfatans]
MKKIQCALSIGLLAAGVAQAVLVDLALPAAGNHASGSGFSTAASFNGATFDIEYTLNAFATSNSPAPFIRSSGGTYFGVGSALDPNTGNQESIDGDDGEQLSIAGLSIVNFSANGSGLVQGDLSIAFQSLSIANGTAANDGITISFTGFGDATVDVTHPTTLDLTSLANFGSSSTALFLEPDGPQSNNRWSVSGISVSVIPEPATLGMVVASAAGMLVIRRRFLI